VASGEVFVHATLATVLLGAGAGFQLYLLVLTAFMPASPIASSRARGAWALGFLVYFVALVLVAGSIGAYYELDPVVINAMRLANVIVAFAILAGIVHHLRQTAVSAQRKLQERARTDVLTGLYNRRGVLEMLERCRADRERHGRQFSVILGDLDRFKAINDRYGHETGDEVLRRTACAIVGTLRGGDSVGRWGGEEFLIALPGNDAETAAQVGQRVIEAVRAVEAPARSSGRTGSRRRGPVVTISLGVATVVEGESLDSLISRADHALYRAKRAGKDRLMVAESVQCDS